MASQVVIAGIYSPPADGIGTAAEGEYVVLVNLGDAPADMRGWSLTNRKQDQTQHYRYLFPRFLSNGDPWELEPGGLILLFTGRGTNGCTATTGEAHQFHLYQHRSTRVWTEPGDTACLFDRSGTLIAEWALPEARRTA